MANPIVSHQTLYDCFQILKSVHCLLFVLDSGCKGTAKFSSVQEGTFWCHSYQEVGIVMLSGFAEIDFNFD